MKKFAVRILGIISVLIFGYQQFCYADIISIPSTDLSTEILSIISSIPLTFLLGFISVVVLIISAISFFSLKATVKKQSMPDYDREKLYTMSTEEIEKKKNKINRRFYVCGTILAIIGLIHIESFGKISKLIFFIPIILLVISIIVRLNKNKKISNIICGVSVILVCIIVLWGNISNMTIENYILTDSRFERISNYVLDVKGFINSVINNNKSDRKVTLIYKDISYTSTDELKQLLSKLDTSKSYSINIKYDDNNDYIEYITLTSYLHPSFQVLQEKYEGSNKKGAEIIGLIMSAIGRAKSSEKEISIVYISEMNEKTIVNLYTDNDESIVNLRDKIINRKKTYNVEFQADSNDGCIIIITCNN